MKFIRDLLGKKRSDADRRGSEPIETLEQSYREAIGSIVEETDALKETSNAPADQPAATVSPRRPPKVSAEKKPADAVNIWDMEDTPGDELPPAGALPERSTELPPAPAPSETPAPSAAAARSPARSRRTKTRLIGFEQSDGAVVDLFNDAPAAAAPKAKSVKFPVGWIVVVEGPGRGESFTMQSGMSQIGRGDDQAIQLDFGDNSISRSNHAAIVYDAETKEFLLGHGGKSNIVRLNNKPVISNESLKTGDHIKIGETVLRFIALCDKSFNWSEGGNEEDEDVAIA